MQQDIRATCPQCGRPLGNFDGHIGYCIQHKWTSPVGLGFDREAAERNRLEEEKEKQKQLEAQRQKEEQSAREHSAQRQKRRKTALLLVLAVLVLLAAFGWFFVLPSMRYRSASDLLGQGEYAAAREAFGALKTYKNSETVCAVIDAVSELRDGKIESAINDLKELNPDGTYDGLISDALLPLLSDWNAQGLSGQNLLLLLKNREITDPNGRLDYERLYREAHVALLGDEVVDSIFDNADGGGDEELIALDRDGAVFVFRMSPDGNESVSVDAPVLADYAALFGEKYAESDPECALACFAEAYRLSPTAEYRTRLEEAYKSKAEILQYEFVNWDRDSYDEVLSLDENGTLTLSGLKDRWTILSAVDTDCESAEFIVLGEREPLILVSPSDRSALLMLMVDGGEMKPLFRKDGISRYERDGNEIRFSEALEGSIVRFADYSYSAQGRDSRPVRTGLDWQKDRYPYPADALSVVERYLEAKAYDISEEQSLLLGSDDASGAFTMDRLLALPAPALPLAIKADAYHTDGTTTLFELNYPAEGKTVRAWAAVRDLKLVGAADSFAEGVSVEADDPAFPLVSLNAEYKDRLAAKGEKKTYRFLLPATGRISFSWRSGEKAVQRTSHLVTLCQGSPLGDVVFTYELQPSPDLQVSRDMFLPAGVYYLNVEAKIPDSAEYSMKLTLKCEENVELESNDSYTSANPIKPNEKYSATLSDAKDIDWFSFTLTETSEVSLKFGGSGSGGKSPAYKLGVYSAKSRAALTSAAVSGDAQLGETGRLYLSEGTYYVKVERGSAYTNAEYSLTVQVSPAENTECEGNDTPESASSLPLDEDIRGSFGCEGDLDYFSFTLTADTVVQPSFTFTPTDSASKTYVLTVMDAARRELLKVNIGGKEDAKILAPLALPAGSYTVKLENPRFVGQEYTLRLVSMPVEAAEREPNDSAGLATELNIGQELCGVIASESDVDFYKLHFDTMTQLHLKFGFPQSTNKNSVFVLSIEQNGKTQWTTNIKGDSGGFEQQLQFPAGEYYIRIKPSAWLGAVYQITLQ